MEATKEIKFRYTTVRYTGTNPIIFNTVDETTSPQISAVAWNWGVPSTCHSDDVKVYLAFVDRDYTT
jgi:hypothetical protein